MSLAARTRSALAPAILLALALTTVVGAASTAEAQRGRGRGRGGVVVAGPRGGGAVVVDPGRRGGGTVVVAPPPERGGAVVVAPPPDRRGGTVVVAPPPERGGTVVVAPPPARRGGAVVVAPPRDERRAGVVIVGPRGVVRAAPPRVTVVAPPPPPRPRVRYAPPARHGDVWIQPYWGWTGSSWEWIEGHWEQPPQADAIWIEPRFEAGGWIPGYWTTPPPAASARYGRPYQIGTQIAGTFSSTDDRDWTGSLYHDYVISMSAGETATFVLVGGPDPNRPGARIDVALSVLSNGSVVANGTTRTGSDSQVTFTATAPSVFLIRASSRGAAFGSWYMLQSSSGQYTPQTSPYDDYWGGGYDPSPQPTYPSAQPFTECRRLLIELGHPGTTLMFCDGAEPYCADALLRAGHPPTSLQFCQGVDPQCAVTMLQQGRSPTELQYCR